MTVQRISLAQLRDDAAAFRGCGHWEDFAPDPDEVLALIEAVEAAQQWQRIAQRIVSTGTLKSGNTVQFVAALAGGRELDKFDFGEQA
jgi:uncharacterized protein CbrC (UPF0167 family)